MKVVTDEGHSTYTGNQIVALCMFAESRFKAKMDRSISKFYVSPITEPIELEKDLIKDFEDTMEEVITMVLQSKLLNPDHVARFTKTERSKPKVRHILITEEEE